MTKKEIAAFQLSAWEEKELADAEFEAARERLMQANHNVAYANDLARMVARGEDYQSYALPA